MDYEKDYPLKQMGLVHAAPRFRDRLNVKVIVLTIMSIVVAYLALVPVVTLIVASFQSDFMDAGSKWTLANFSKAFLNSGFYSMLLNSIIYALVSTVLSLCIGVFIAWLYVRTNTPLKRLVMVTALVPFIVPGILNAMAWIFLMSPSIGIVNLLFESLFSIKPFNIYSMGGMIFVEAIHNSPLAFTLALATFSSIDSSLEESAFMSGASHYKVFRSITLKMAIPGFFAAGLLIFIRAISGFEVPQLIGVPGNIYVFVSMIYESINSFPPSYGVAAALGGVVMVIAIGGAYISNRITAKGERYATISGKGFKPTQIDLGKWRWLGGTFIALTFIVTVLMPILTLLWASLLPNYHIPSLSQLTKLSFINYKKILEYPNIVRAFKNSLILSVATGVITMLLSSIIAYITIKTKIKGRWLLDMLTFLPIAVPGIVMGMGILFWYLIAPLPIKLYGSLTILCITFVTTHIPYGIRYMSSGMVQIKDELEEAGNMSGASWQTVFVRIYVPLLVPSLMAGFIYTLITVFREVSSAIFLYTQGTEIVSIAVYDLWRNGEFTVTAAIGMVLILVLIIFIYILQKIGNKAGIQRS
jgi:iron(III) transport system permease protein